MENVCLIVGLGNPGSEYARTRHNAGFDVVNRLAARWKTSLNFEKKFNAVQGWAERGDRKVLLCEPQTYMNCSGEAVGAVMSFYRLPRSRLLVVVDDADLPLGELRMRPSGSSGGHHGLESIEQHLDSREYARLRVGIGRPESERRIAGHVLGRFSSTETELLNKVIEAAADQAECWVERGIQKAMNEFNGPVIKPAAEDEGNTQ